MITKFLILTVVAALVNAQYGDYQGHGHQEHVVVKDYYAHPKYEFKYGVDDPHTGDQKQQHEVRDGDVVKGEYSLKEPDGTIRIVKYTADKHNGFNAIVERKGHAAHPQVVHKVIQPVVHKVITPVKTVISHHQGYGFGGGYGGGFGGGSDGGNEGGFGGFGGFGGGNEGGFGGGQGGY